MLLITPVMICGWIVGVGAVSRLKPYAGSQGTSDTSVYWEIQANLLLLMS